MALIQFTPGNLPTTRQTGGSPNAPGGTLAEGLFSELMPQYYTLIKAGIVFSAPVLAANPTAFTGGAAGTPLFGIYNPANSGKDLVMLMLGIGIRSTGSAAAATMDLNWFQCNQGGVAVTGTQTQCRNMYSQANTGSVAWAMVNTANTAALASQLTRTSLSLGNVAASAVLNVGLFMDDIKGIITVAPGCYAAFGASLGLTAGSIDITPVWAEIPA